jgi:ParB family chromosome partitioning protein
METTVINATEYRDLPLAMLTESRTNPRRIFEDGGLKELAESIRSQGVLSPLLVRPLNEQGFEIVAGARRYRAAQLAEVPTVPVRIVHLSDAAMLEAQLVENLMRRDVHPMEEVQGFKALLDLEEPKYSIEQIAARTGKNVYYITTRLKLNELAQSVVDAFYREEIGVGHALLLAKLPADQREQALSACFKEDWSAGGQKSKRILLPVRSLQFWIDTNVLLLLKDAPFDKRNAQLVPAAGSCIDCSKRTGHNKLLFSDFGKQDACTSPSCYQATVDAHITVTVAEKPKLVQISTAYGQQREGSPVLPRNRYTAIIEEKPKSRELAQRPEYKTCKFTTEAIVAEGSGQGTLQKVCANPDCPVHHPKVKVRPQDGVDNDKWRAQREKEQKERAISEATGVRVLSAIGAAVPVRLMKRDLLFVTERLAAMLDDNRLIFLAKQHGIKKAKDSDSIGKLFSSFLRRAEESLLGRITVELTIVLAASRGNAPQVLRDAAQAYKVDTDAIALKARQEFAAKEKGKGTKKVEARSTAAAKRKTA